MTENTNPKLCPKCEQENYQCTNRNCGKVGCQTKNCENHNFDANGHCHTCDGHEGMMNLASPKPASPESAKPTKPTQAVNVVDINMPFGSMVAFMVKWAFAAIPALIIIAIVWAILGAILGGVFLF